MDKTHVSSFSYRPDIDGLRALAVLFVIIFHAFPSFLSGGYIGVDVFFVISGFLISGILYKELETGKINLTNFYARRIRRIFPALLCVLVFSLVIGWFYLLPQEFNQIGKHTLGAAGFVSNFFLWKETGYFDVDSKLKPLLHLWSLGIEEQFYLFFPLFLVSLNTKRKALSGIVFVLVCSFVLNAAVINFHTKAVFFHPFTRVWELLVGCVLSYVTRQKHTPPPL